MKIIHCADLHIDSRKFQKFSAKKREIKRSQLLQNFVDLVDFAKKNRVDAVLLCGDIFDDKKPLKRSLKVVQDTILAHKNIKFFYIWGNHDENVHLFDKTPENFVEFGENFGKFSFGNVEIGGVSFKRHFDDGFYDSIAFDKNKFNILMLHSQVVSDKYFEAVDLKRLENKGIDYLAFGHIHKRDCGRFGKRGLWNNVGCLEANSFANLGKCGFNLIEIGDEKYTNSFVPFSKYDYQEATIDVSNLTATSQLNDLVGQALDRFSSTDIVRIVLRGKRKEDLKINVGVLEETFKNKVFYLEVEDDSRIDFDLEKYANEALSLKAEFIRLVMADESLSAEEKQQICESGIEALKGEEVSL